jgi:uncharacterized membrane protein YdbT with pleckstrin-like domain
MLPAAVITGLLALVPVVVFVAIPAAGFEFSGIGQAAAVAATSGYYLALVTYFFVRWLDFYLDIAIVTSDRIVDIDQHGLFRRTVDELDCKMIQDVSAAKHGVFQTLFNFGTVEIQTAGERRNFTFANVPDPDRVQELVAKSQGMGEAEEGRAAARENAEAAAEKAKEAAAAATRATKAETAAKRPTSPPDPGARPNDAKHLGSQDLPREHE